jgi:hypothetical protein
MPPSHESPLKTYKVKLGHAEVTVKGHDETEAVKKARKALSNELPRLWDKIYQVDDKQFVIHEVR